ncbi:hypothetical protein ABIA68_002106 [Stenotrophomonas rhizophila]|uniref:hypothetical protein n=1 Tax=Stenotrophomonas rhizophila TaxID=216778 RepID=UPI003395B40D
MSAVLCILALIAACMCIAFGAVRIGTWAIQRRDEAATRPIRDAAFAANATAELRRNEIEASKRGDLLGAARFAEMAEVSGG